MDGVGLIVLCGRGVGRRGRGGSGVSRGFGQRGDGLRCLREDRRRKR